MQNDSFPWSMATATAADLPPGHPDARAELEQPLPPGYVWGTLRSGDKVPVLAPPRTPESPSEALSAASRGLSTGERRAVVWTSCGSVTLLTLGGVTLLIAQGVQTMQPALPDLVQMVKYGALALAALVALVVVVCMRRGRGPLVHLERTTTNVHATTTNNGWFNRTEHRTDTGKK